MSATSNNQPRLIVDRQAPGLRETLWDLVGQAKGNDVLAPVTVVGPTRYANLSLRHEFGRRGFANVRFIILPALTELLGAATLASSGRRPLTATLEGVAMRAALSNATGPLAPVRGHPSTQASLRATFRELRNAPADVLTQLETQGGVRGEVVRLYRDFRRNTSGAWYDTEDLAMAAAEAVRQGTTPGLNDLGLIVFYLPRELTPAQTRLVEALAQQDRCAVLLGTTGDQDANRHITELAEAFQFSNPPSVCETSDQGPEPLPGDTSLHIAPNAHEELRWVIRQVVREAEEKRTPFHRMAILYRAENPYATLIPDELDLAHIPVAGPSRTRLADTGTGRTLLGLLGLADGKFARADVIAWLTGCPVRPPAGRTPGFNPSHWDSLSRKAGVVSGLEQWRNRLGYYADDLELQAKERLEKDEITEARAARMGFEANAARNAEAFVNLLAADLQPPEDGSPWEKFCIWAEDLLKNYLSHDVRENDRDVERVEELLGGLRAADTIIPDTTLQTFRQTVEEALHAPVGQLGPTGQGVFVSSFAAAAGMSFDAVWMVGMIEGAVPPAVRPDPLIPESGWRDAGGQSRAARRMTSERHEYLSALDSAPRRTLSYPVADGASQRKAYPSRWFLEQARELEGQPVRTADLPGLQGRPWLTITESGEHALTGAHVSALADRHDYQLHRLLAWRQAGERVSRHPLVGEGNSARAIRAGLSRNLRRFTEFDGNLSSLAETGKFQLGLAQPAVSATRLESWARCPFSYYLSHVLRLSALETPEETTTISALDRGDLVHKILEKFIETAIAAGELPPANEQWSTQARARLFAMAETAFSVAEERGVTGKYLLWQLAKQEIQDDLESFLEQDLLLRSIQDTGRVEVEVEFGLSDANPTVLDPATQVRFRGKIDRVDVSSDGKSVLVLDYKTGSPGPYAELEKDIIDAGRRLQLGVYSLAAQQLVPGATSIQAAYWFATNRGGFQFAPAAYFHISDNESGDRFRQAVSTIVGGIQRGLFPANPGPQDRGSSKNCQYCDFDSLCPARREDIWQRKMSDDLLSGYLSLSPASEEASQ